MNNVDMNNRFGLIRSVIIIVELLLVLCFSACSATWKGGNNIEKEQAEKEYTLRTIRRGGDLREQFSFPNSEYILKKKIDLRGQTIAIAPECILHFKGGSINDGVIIGNKTTIVGRPKIGALIRGTFLNKEVKSSWFSNNTVVTVAAIKAACASGATYVVDDNRELISTIYLFGKGGLKGRGGSLNFIDKTSNGACILCGTDGERPNIWQGSIDSLEINIRDYRYGIALCNVSHCAITNTVINAFTTPTYRSGKLIGRFNNSELTHVSGQQTDILIEGNVLNMHGSTDGTKSKASYESISVCDFTDNARILNNTINNSTDDLGIHSSSNIQVEGNSIVTEVGRIYCADSRDVIIAKNSLGCYSSSMGIMVTMESKNRICENIRISDNYIRPLGFKVMDYGIRVNNGKHIIIYNNIVEGQLHIGYNKECVIENLSYEPKTFTEQDTVVDYVEVRNNSFTQIIGAGWNMKDNKPTKVVIENNIINGGKVYISNIPSVRDKNNVIIEK